MLFPQDSEVSAVAAANCLENSSRLTKINHPRLHLHSTDLILKGTPTQDSDLTSLLRPPPQL